MINVIIVLFVLSVILLVFYAVCVVEKLEEIRNPLKYEIKEQEQQEEDKSIVARVMISGKETILRQQEL